MHPLVDQLLQEQGARWVEGAGLDAFLEEAADGALLFVRGEALRKPETADVAVVVRELLREFDGRLQVGVVADRDEAEIKRRYGVLAVPSVVYVRGGKAVSTIPRIADWPDYKRAAEQMLAAA